MRDELTTAYSSLFQCDSHEASTRLGALTADAIHGAFRRRAKRVHPDRAHVVGEEPRALTERFFHLEAARDRLLRQVKDASSHRVRTQREHLALPPPEGRTDLPAHPLCFGQFLYYSGRASWDAVKSALSWQRENHQRLGELARGWRLLTEDQVRVVRRARRPRERFGDTALRLGYLKAHDCNTLVAAQRASHRRVGQYFVELGALSAGELCVLVQRQREHNRRVECK